MTTSRAGLASARHVVAMIGLLSAGQLLAACQSRGAGVDLAAEEQAIKQASIDFSNAETSGKPESALAFIWDNAVLQPPDAPQVEGRDAIPTDEGAITRHAVEKSGALSVAADQRTADQAP